MKSSASRANNLSSYYFDVTEIALTFTTFFINKSIDQWRRRLEIVLATHGDTLNILFKILYNFSDNCETL